MLREIAADDARRADDECPFFHSELKLKSVCLQE
jgi:hypothetical protein